MSEVVWWRGSCSASLSSCPGGVACVRWWLGGNCYHRRCVAACRRRVGGLWSQNPPRACSKCSPPRWYAGDMGFLGCSGRRFGRGGWVDGGVVARLCAGGPFMWQCWSCSTSLSSCPGGVACFRWWLGGNCYHRRCVAACRRRVGGLWSQNPPGGCLEGPASRARGGVYGCKSPGWLLKVQSTSVECG